MSLVNEFLSQPGPTWVDGLLSECDRLSLIVTKGFSHDGGRYLGILRRAETLCPVELDVIDRPWGLFIRLQRILYVCRSGVTAQAALLHVAIWIQEASNVGRLIETLDLRIYPLRSFEIAGRNLTKQLLANIGWELLSNEETESALDDFETTAGENVLGVSQTQAVESTKTKIVLSESQFDSNATESYRQERGLRRMLIDSIVGSGVDNATVYFFNVNHDCFRLDWSLNGGRRLESLPWPTPFLFNAIVVVYVPELKEAFRVRGMLLELTGWGTAVSLGLANWANEMGYHHGE